MNFRDEIKMKSCNTAIVSGAAGFVGYHLVNNLNKKGIHVIALCRPNSEHNKRLKDFENVKIIECEASHYLLIKDVLQYFTPDIFFHLEWEGTTGEDRSNYEIQLNNIRNTCDAYICASEIGCKKFIATGTVYEELTSQILANEKFSALSYYVMSKHFAYESLYQLSKKIQLDWTWCTFCQPIGKYIKKNQLSAYLVAAFKRGETPVLGTGMEPFDMIPVEDLAEGLYIASNRILKKKKYFIGSGNAKYVKDYVVDIWKIINPSIELIFGNRSDDNLRFSKEWLDGHEFFDETGFECVHSFEESVRNIEKWLEESK